MRCIGCIHPHSTGPAEKIEMRSVVVPIVRRFRLKRNGGPCKLGRPQCAMHASTAEGTAELVDKRVVWYAQR